MLESRFKVSSPTMHLPPDCGSAPDKLSAIPNRVDSDILRPLADFWLPER